MKEWITWHPIMAIMVFGFFAVAILFMSRWVGLLLRAHAPWVPLSDHGYYPGSKCYADREIDPDKLVRALQAAESALIRRTPWNAANLALVGHYVCVRVNGHSHYEHPTIPVMHVDAEFTSLCHELAHLCELVLDGRVDTTHERWNRNGANLAMADYANWLSGRGHFPVQTMNGSMPCHQSLSRN